MKEEPLHYQGTVVSKKPGKCSSQLQEDVLVEDIEQEAFLSALNLILFLSEQRYHEPLFDHVVVIHP